MGRAGLLIIAALALPAQARAEVVPIADAGPNDPAFYVDSSPAPRAQAPQITANPTAQHAYIAKVSNSGTYPVDDAGVQTAVTDALSRWKDESNGAITSFTVSDFKSFSTATDCQSGPSMWTEAAKLWPSTDFGTGSANHLIVIAPQACAGGIGTLGSGITSGGRLSVNYNPAKNLHSLMHELGHNFGLNHAHACYADGAATCADHEYGNDYAIMGTSIVHTPPFTPAALDSFERTRLKITDSGEVQTVTLPAGKRSVTQSFDLHARGTATGLRGLRVTDPVSGAVYSIDWRSGGGRDALSYYASSLVTYQDQFYNPGVTVETVQPDGSYSTLQSYAKPTASDGDQFGYTTGQTFNAAGLKLDVGATGDATDANAVAHVTLTLTNPAVIEQPDPTPTATPPADPEPTVPAATATPTAGPAPTAGATATPTPTGTPSTGTTPTKALPSQTGAITVTGAPGVKQTVTASPVAWTHGAAFYYQWFADGKPIPGARTSTFQIPASLRGHQLAVAVAALHQGFSLRFSASQPVLVGRFTGSARPRIGGTARVGRTVTADPRTTWSPRPTLHYRWYANGHRIKHATKRKLHITNALRTKRIVVRVTAQRSGFSAATARSAGRVAH